MKDEKSLKLIHQNFNAMLQSELYDSLRLYRLLLAALHYNENRDREQAVTESGEKAFTISFSRAKSGDYVVRKRSVAATFGKTLWIS